MSTELKATVETEPTTTVISEPVDTTRKKTDKNTDPDPYCCSPGPGDGGPDT